MRFKEIIKDPLKAYKCTSLGVLEETFKTLGQQNRRIQASHQAITFIGFVVVAIGYALQMRALARPETAADYVPLQRSGAGIFGGGYALAAVYHLYATYQMTKHHTAVALMKRALDEEYKLFLFSKVSALAPTPISPAASMPTLPALTEEMTNPAAAEAAGVGERAPTDVTLSEEGAGVSSSVRARASVTARA